MKQLHERVIRLAAPETEFSWAFVQGMANRMAVSFHKYGPVSEGYPAKVSAIDSLLARINAYVETGNTEYMMDAANFAMIEFMHPSLEDAAFLATDSDGSPGRVSVDGETTYERNEEISGTA